jgi:hypothetical protein
MIYLSDSYFSLIVSVEEIDGEFRRSSLENKRIILTTYEYHHSKLGFEKILDIASSVPDSQFFTLLDSDKNVQLLRTYSRSNLHFGVFIPTDQLIYPTVYFKKTYNFGYQLDLLRRLHFALNDPFVICIPDEIGDMRHYLEMVLRFTHQVYPIADSKHSYILRELYMDILFEQGL